MVDLDKMSHPIQAMMNGWSQEMQHQRTKTQMTLGKLIETLKELSAGRKLTGFGIPHSYRGYYSDLSFQPNPEIVTVAELLKRCQGAMGQIFEGYKGGEFMMGANTPVWISSWGSCSNQRLMGLDISKHPIEPITEEDK